MLGCGGRALPWMTVSIVAMLMSLMVAMGAPGAIGAMLLWYLGGP